MFHQKQIDFDNNYDFNDVTDIIHMKEKEKATQQIFPNYSDTSFFTEPLAKITSNSPTQNSAKTLTLPSVLSPTNLSAMQQHLPLFNELFNDDFLIQAVDDISTFNSVNEDANQIKNSNNSTLANKTEIVQPQKDLHTNKLENNDITTQKFKNHQNILFSPLNYYKVDITKPFDEQLKDTSLKINPFLLGFEPQKYWVTMRHDHTFNQIVNYFRSRLSKNTMFMYKLYNMLLLTTKVPQLKSIVGVFWINKFVFCVERDKIARMLGLSNNCVNGALFNMQGNFPTHGFIEVTSDNLKEFGLTENSIKFQVDVFYYAHKDRTFSMRNMTADEINDIKYKNENKRIYRSKQKTKL